MPVTTIPEYVFGGWEEILTKSIKSFRILQTNYLVFSKLIITFSLFIFAFQYFGIPLTFADPQLSASLHQHSGRYILFVEKQTEEPIQQALIYKNNRLFARAYPATETYEKGVVSFIFDDGWLDIYTDAYPVFQKHNKSATIAVISNYVDTKGGLSTRHIRKLINAGWDVAAHSINDASMLTLSRTEQYQALLLSKDVLWKRFWATQNFIFPYGHYDQLLMKMAQQQYKSARGYEPGINTFPVDPFNLKVISLEHDTKDSQIISAIDQVAQQKGWLIFVGHHVSDQDTSEYSLGAEKYDYALEYIATKDLQVLTYDQAIQTLVPHAALIQEGQLRFEIDPRLVHPLDIFYVVIDGKRTKLIQVPTQI